MTDKVPMPADGGGEGDGRSDGTNDPGQRGRSEGGESGGGGYANPHTGKEPQGGIMGHGGQTDIGYHGGGRAGTEGAPATNSTTRGDGDLDAGEAEAGSGPGPNVPEQDRVAAQTHEAVIDGRPVAIVNESGVAAAEAAGNTGASNQ